jgi:hypothetical protein
MRLPLEGDDYFIREVNAAFENIREAYLKALKPQIIMKKANVMLGDGSVVQSDTFEIYCKKLADIVFTDILVFNFMLCLITRLINGLLKFKKNYLISQTMQQILSSLWPTEVTK